MTQLEKDGRNSLTINMMNSLYKNNDFIKEKQIIISKTEHFDNENFPKLFYSSYSTHLPCSTQNLAELTKLIIDVDPKYYYNGVKSEEIVNYLKDKKLISKCSRNDLTRKRINNIIAWKKTNFFNVLSKDLSDGSKSLMVHSNLKYLETDLNKIKCVEEVHQKIIEKILAINEKLASKRDENFQDTNIALSPIFIWVNYQNLVSQKVINNIYSFIKNIIGTISCENFIVILFIEKDSNNNDEFEESFNKFLISIESIHQDVTKSVFVNFINDKNASLFKQKTFMQCLSKHLNLERYYSVNEKIDTFFEYNNILEEFKNSSNSTVKALDFMAKVLSQSAFETSEEISVDNLDTIFNFFFNVSKKNLINKDQKDMIKSLIDDYKSGKIKKDCLSKGLNRFKELKSKLNNDLVEDFDQTFNILQGSKSQFISEIVLGNRNEVKASDMCLLNRQCELYFTHKHSKPRYYDVVLYNTTATDSIFPIELPSDQAEENDTVGEEDFYFYKLLRKTASCYVVYFYTCKTNFLEYGN